MVVGELDKTTRKLHQRLGNIAKKYGLMIAVTSKPHTIFLYNPNGDDISQNAIDNFAREGFDFRGFRLGGSDSVLEIEHKRVAELVYDKEFRKKDHNIIKSWFARHWKSVALLAGWLIGLYLFFTQLPL
jgi:hypothetical protein